jgi:long-chain fatty acid transport protein
MKSIVCVILLVPAAAGAAGFAVADQSAVAGGTAGAGTARDADPSAAWYNPAGLADGGGLRLGAGLLAAAPSLTAEARDGAWSAGSVSGVSTPPHLYGSYAVGRHAFGVAANVPFGSGVTWPEAWEGRFEIVSSRLEVFRLQPFYALRLGRVRVGGGVHVDLARMRVARKLDFVDAEGDVALDLSGAGVGAHAAVFVEAGSGLELGLTVKSRTRLSLAGAADFTVPDAFAGRASDQTVETELTIPDRLTAGVRWRRGRTAVLVDAEVTAWSAYDGVVLDFADDDTPDTMQAVDWGTTVAVRGGVEHALGAAWTVRGGAYVDPSPASSQTLTPSSPDSTRLGATVGGSRAVSRSLHVDAFAEYMHLLGRAAENVDALDARYSGWALLFGVGVRYTR